MSIQPLDGSVVSFVERRDTVAGCPCGDDVRWREHHDRLLSVEGDADELVELLELAVTWSELDWSGAAVVPPERWVDFAAAHRWGNRDRVLRLFALAADIALRSGAGPAAGPLATVRQLAAATTALGR